MTLPTSSARGASPSVEELRDRLIDVVGNAERRGEVVARSEWDDAELHHPEAAGDARDAVEDLVERAVAAADEQVIHAIVDGAGRRGRGVAFADRHHDLQHPHALAQEAIDDLESVRS